MNEIIRAEFHCHSNYSFDSLASIENMIATCRKKGIGKLAITDHGRMFGSVAAQKLAPDLVIVAEEILTSEGEILAYFMKEEIPDGLEPMEVIQRLRDQGAFISVAHPFDPWRGSHWKDGTLEAMVPFLDGFEVFNARCFNPEFNEEARRFAEVHGLAFMAGSDAHSLGELGQASMIMPDFNTAEEMREAVKSAKIEATLSSKTVRFRSTAAKIIKKFSSNS